MASLTFPFEMQSTQEIGNKRRWELCETKGAKATHKKLVRATENAQIFHSIMFGMVNFCPHNSFVHANGKMIANNNRMTKKKKNTTC